jgi:hypothetical protein
MSADAKTAYTAGFCLALFLTTSPSSFGADEDGVGTAEFDAQAFAALPVEKPYAFHKALSNNGWRARRDPDSRPTPDEMVITENGWSLLIKSGASQPLRQAADDLRDYLETAMHTHVSRQDEASLTNWAKSGHVIVAGASRDLPGCGNVLTATKDYQIIVTSDRIVVCGYDDLGAMYGLYNL